MSELAREDEFFTVDDDLKAEWCMAKIKEAEDQKSFWKDYYEMQYQKVCDTCDLTIHNMEAMLRGFFDSVPHKVTKTQEIYPLPSGKLVFKAQEPEYERDDNAVLAWLKENGGGQYVKTKEALDWAGLKKTLTVCGETVADENGAIIPGIRAVEREPIFKVELKKEG